MQDKKKPTADPFIKYYILWPIENVIESIADFFKGIWRKLTGAWWCDHCEAYHGRRVHMFYVKPNAVQQLLKSMDRYKDKYVCSLGKDAMWNTDSSPLEDLQNAIAKIDAQTRSKQESKTLEESIKEVDEAMHSCVEGLNKLKDLTS